MPNIRIRPARATDRGAVESICARTWEENDDYVPHAWDDWLADAHGELVVAELAGQVAGLAKLSRLGEDERWLEGLRVAPDHQRQGIAGRLQAYLVERARRSGGGTLRFGTHSRNEPIQHLAAHDEFRHIATYRVYEAEPLAAADSPSPRLLTEADLAAAWGLIEGSPRYRAASGLYETFWSWRSLTRRRLARHLRDGDVWSLGTDRAAAALALVCPTQKEDAIDIGYADGAADALRAILLALRGLGARRGCTKVRFRPVDEESLLDAVEAAGYEPGWDRDLWIFELRL